MTEEIKIKKNVLVGSCWENKNNFNIFCLFFNRTTTDLVKKNLLLLVMSKEKIKTQKSCFLVGVNFILSEDTSNIEYSESALKG